jgi:parallel beta-helix repeat protein
MPGTSLRRDLVIYPMVLMGLIIILFSLAGTSLTFAQDDAGYLRQVRAIDMNDCDLLNPAGLTFLLDAGDSSIINLNIADTGLSGGPGRAAVFPPGGQVASASEFRIYPSLIMQTANEGNNGGRELGRITKLTPRIIYVPGNASTIQAAIDVASDGDLVLVAPGVYHENIQLSGKTIILASQYYTTRNPSFIDQTIIDGNGDTVIAVSPSVGPETKIIGFTILNGQDGISASAKFHILNNRFTLNSDAIDYESGGGTCSNNVFENNRDDAIDLDGSTEVTIENNIIHNNGDDGIEARLHSYSGPTLTIIIRKNIITGNGEDGIQLIDYPDVSDRVFLIERNVIQGSAMVGVGLMDDGESVEDFRAANIPERIYLFNNTFVDNDHGLTGGDNLIALNNIFAGSANIAMKNVDGNSIASYNLFWGNGIDHQNSNLDTTHTILENPLLNVNYRLNSGSPALDSGTAFFIWNSEIVLDLQPDVYSGAAPDLGAFETWQLFLPIILKPGTAEERTSLGCQLGRRRMT